MQELKLKLLETRHRRIPGGESTPVELNLDCLPHVRSQAACLNRRGRDRDLPAQPYHITSGLVIGESPGGES
jgi:hypothetical protein